MKNLVKMVVLLAIITLGGSCFAQCDVRCKAAFNFVVSHEDRNLTGVISPEPFGGVARFGVNSHAHPEAVRAGFYRMSRTRALQYAQNLFARQYWTSIHGDRIEDMRLAFRMVDLAYNLGPIRATILLQRALNQQGANLYDRGYFGEDTLYWANYLNPAQTVFLLKNQARTFYRRLADKYPVMRTWKGVWMERLAEPELASSPLPQWLENFISSPHELPMLTADNCQHFLAVQYVYPDYKTVEGVSCR